MEVFDGDWCSVVYSRKDTSTQHVICSLRKIFWAFLFLSFVPNSNFFFRYLVRFGDFRHA